MLSCRVRRRGDEKQSLAELTKRNKSICSISLAISITGKEEMSPAKN
jgi:hypothetical protein